jgi:hypothetical protein
MGFPAGLLSEIQVFPSGPRIGTSFKVDTRHPLGMPFQSSIKLSGSTDPEILISGWKQIRKQGSRVLD